MTKIKWLSTIRISGLLLVLVYHFFRDILPGGFIGVDVFFTLSGYLVTASIVEEFRSHGKFSLFSFYKRRFLRLYPPLLLSILFSLPFALLVSTDFTVNIGRQLGSALGFATNYFEIAGGGSYEGRMLPHLFLHTWFLAVEVHLYLVWALFCAVVVLCLKSLYKANSETSLTVLKVLLFSASLAGALFSYLRMQSVFPGADIDPSASYFDSAARAFPFLFGAAAGSFFQGVKPKEETGLPFFQKLQAALMIGVMVMAATALFALARFLTFSGEEAYRYGFVSASLLAVVLILSARRLHELTDGTNEPRPLSAAADLSYNVYLFHWPLYNVFFYSPRTSQLGFWNNSYAAIAAFAVSVFLSALSFYCIEPFFRRRLPLSDLGIPALRRAAYALVFLFLASAVPLSGFVLSRSPEISSLEEQLYTGYLFQDVDEVEQLNHLTEVVNGEPLFLARLLPVTGIMENRTFTMILPKPDYNELSKLPVSFNKDGILSGVTIIGDSVCLGARRNLSVSIANCHVDVEGSRQMYQGYYLMSALQNNDSLREYVVIALGTNQNVNSFNYIEQIISDLRPGHRLIFVTPYNGAMNESWITYKIMQYLRQLPALYPFVTVADWAELIGNQPMFLNADKIHIGGNTPAINLYTNCIIDAIGAAAAKPAKQ
jgi:peptidoglycan/LPS O-acetylase OafA/YrhL